MSKVHTVQIKSGVMVNMTTEEAIKLIQELFKHVYGETPIPAVSPAPSPTVVPYPAPVPLTPTIPWEERPNYPWREYDPYKDRDRPYWYDRIWCGTTGMLGNETH